MHKAEILALVYQPIYVSIADKTIEICTQQKTQNYTFKQIYIGKIIFGGNGGIKICTNFAHSNSNALVSFNFKIGLKIYINIVYNGFHHKWHTHST